jgi:hypothetical protein
MTCYHAEDWPELQNASIGFVLRDLSHFESNLLDGADSMARRRDLIIIAILVSRHQIGHYFRSIYVIKANHAYVIEVYLIKLDDDTTRSSRPGRLFWLFSSQSGPLWISLHTTVCCSVSSSNTSQTA